MAQRLSPRARQRGAGLIDVALAIVVGILIVASSAVAVKKNRDRAITQELAAEEDLVFQASDAYYRASCTSGSLPASVTTATLQSQGHLPRAARNVWGATWSISYLTAPRRVQVTAALVDASPTLIPFIASYTKAFSFSGTSVTWRHNLRIVYDTTSANNLDFKAMYETSNC